MSVLSLAWQNLLTDTELRRNGLEHEHGAYAYALPFYYTSYLPVSSRITTRTHFTTMTDATIKGLPPPPKSYDGSNLRICIVHARWNDAVIKALVAGCVSKLKEQGVKEENIVIKTVPGSYELPFACSK